MRVTNAMTSNQLLLNLNRSMNSLSFLQYQYQTGNKIRYASDDPIVAARALKFRTNLAEVGQYLANVDQGKAWLSSTANPVKNILEALSNSGETSVRSLLVAASNGDKTIDDSKIYANQMKETLNEILGELNTTYAGRYLFSGLKTDQKCVFDGDMPNLNMDITQKFSFGDIDKDYKVYLKLNEIIDVDASKKPTSATPAASATLAASATAMPQEISVYRLKLPYSEGIDATSIKGLVAGKVTGVNSSDPEAYLPDEDAIHYIEDTGELIFGSKAYADIATELNTIDTATAQIPSDVKDIIADLNKLSNPPTAGEISSIVNKLTNLNTAITNLNSLGLNYLTTTEMVSTLTAELADVQTAMNDVSTALANLDQSKPETQKALTSAITKAKNLTQSLYTVTNDEVTPGNSFKLTYTKEGFKKNDINPAAYFDCTDTSVNPPKTYSTLYQHMEYEFGIGNRMIVNTLGRDVLTTDILNDIYDAISLAESITVSDKDALIASFMSAPPSGLGVDYEQAEKMADEQITNEDKFYQDMITQKYTDLIGKLDKHTTEISKENTSIGSRLSRLELISNRLLDDRVNFEELKVNNENVDMAEAYIRYQSMYSVYQSALQMGSKVVQMTLVNYI